MNLHAIVAPLVGVINPMVNATVQVSTGYTTAADGSRVPAYAPPVTVKTQFQALQYNDIVQADALGVQGVRSKVYITGEVDGLVRAQGKGGDLITTPDGKVWKVAVVAENWPGWTCAIVTLQNNS